MSSFRKWMPVNFIVAAFRALRFAKSFQKIWTGYGSPLLLNSTRQEYMLAEKLGNDFQVELAMYYQNPSIEHALQNFRKPTFKKIKVVLLFPQHSLAVADSVREKIKSVVSKWEVVPEVEFAKSYFNDEKFIHAFAEKGKKYFFDTYDHVLFCFRGLPERELVKEATNNYCLTENCCAALTEKNALCYRAQCFETARLLAKNLEVDVDDYMVCFQSLPRTDAGIKPIAENVIEELAEKKGMKKLLVFAPSHTSDCFETLYTIGVEYKELFKKHGGEKLELMEAMNNDALWMEALAEVCRG